MKPLYPLALLATLAYAQERCDAPYPKVYCNTTEILAYETSDCRPFHIFLTRGSDEPYPGRLGNLTREICETIGGTKKCSFESVQYPAKSTAWGVDEWCKSASKGAANGQTQIKAYAEKCPDAKLILLGYSQGAAVTQDILGGGGGHVFSCDQPTSPALNATSGAGKNIIAAITFGAVIRTHNQPFSIGTGAPFDGRRARTPPQLAALNQYASVLRDYCHYGDPMCAVGSEPADVYSHLDYFLQHNEEVVGYVGGVVKGNVSESSAASRPSGAVQSSAVRASATGSRTGSASAEATSTSKTVAQAAQTGDAKTGGAGSMVVVSVGYVVLAAGVAVALL